MIVFACGRLNPPTKGHQRIVDKIHELAAHNGGTPLIFLTKTQDAERNPLAADVKVEMVKRAFHTPVQLTTSPFSAVDELVEQGVGEAVIVVGQDRAEYFRKKKLVVYAASVGLNLSIETLTRTEDDVSATRARQAVLESDFSTFASLVPAPDAGFARELYQAVSLGLEEDDAGGN
jgi:hypothetical protein